jgi:hypothetical protein
MKSAGKEDLLAGKRLCQAAAWLFQIVFRFLPVDLGVPFVFLP